MAKTLPAQPPRGAADGRSRAAKPDGRSALARRFRRLCQDFAADLGGEDSLTAAERALIRQAASMVMQAEEAQADLLSGRTVDADAMVRLSNASARLLSALGVQRRKRQPQHVAPWRRKTDDDGEKA